MAWMPEPLSASQAIPQLRGGFSVALQAQRPYVGEIALAAPFGDRGDVVGVPKARAPQALQTPVAQQARSPAAG